MTSQPDRWVVFDVNRTVGTLRFDCSGQNISLIPRESIRALLGELSPGINRGAVLERLPEVSVDLPTLLGNIYPLFTPSLYPAVRLSSVHDDAPSQRIVFVSNSRIHREAMIHRNSRVVPHPDFIMHAFRDDYQLTYVRIASADDRPIADIVGKLPVLPFYLPMAHPGVVYAITTTDALAELQSLGCDVERRPMPDPHPQGAPATTDMYLLRDCLDDEDLVARIKSKAKAYWPVDEGYLLALDHRQEVSNFHPARRTHGHTVWLPPMRFSASERNYPDLVLSPATDDEVRIIRSELTPQLIAPWTDSFSSKAVLPGKVSQKVHTRAEYTEGNYLAASALCQVLRHIFQDETRACLLGLEPTKNVFNVDGFIPGTTSEAIILGAHLDSRGDSPLDAPGGDDDGSGMAALLAIAKVLQMLSSSNPPRRTIRFAFFNQEETGFCGSGDYATILEETKDLQVVAMIQLDMVGRPTATPANHFQIHPPGAKDFSLSDLALQRCNELADLIAAKRTGAVLEAEVLRGPNNKMSTRSDHKRFLAKGWPACLVMEKAFSCECTDIDVCNKLYHTSGDIVVDPEYVAPIAQAVAIAAWSMSK